MFFPLVNYSLSLLLCKCRNILVIPILLQVREVNTLINNSMFYEVVSICIFIKKKQPHVLSICPSNRIILEVQYNFLLNFRLGHRTSSGFIFPLSIISFPNVSDYAQWHNTAINFVFLWTDFLFDVCCFRITVCK